MLTRKTYTPDLEAEAAPIRLLARFLFPDARSRKHSDASDKTPKPPPVGTGKRCLAGGPYQTTCGPSNLPKPRQAAPAKAFDHPPLVMAAVEGEPLEFGRHLHLLYEQTSDKSVRNT
jgi:hypothetical protein